MACSAFCSAARFRCTSAISSCSFFGSFMICFTCADAGRWRSKLRERLDLPWNAGLLHYSSRRVRRKLRLDEACYTRHFLLAIVEASSRFPGLGGVHSPRAPPAGAGRAPGPWGCASASPACAPRSAPSPAARAPCLPSQRPDPRPQPRSFRREKNTIQQRLELTELFEGVPGSVELRDFRSDEFY